MERKGAFDHVNHNTDKADVPATSHRKAGPERVVRGRFRGDTLSPPRHVRTAPHAGARQTLDVILLDTLGGNLDQLRVS